MGEGGEHVDKVEGGGAEENRDGGHSVGNLGRIIDVFTVDRGVETSSETEKALAKTARMMIKMVWITHNALAVGDFLTLEVCCQQG